MTKRTIDKDLPENFHNEKAEYYTSNKMINESSCKDSDSEDNVNLDTNSTIEIYSTTHFKKYRILRTRMPETNRVPTLNKDSHKNLSGSIDNSSNKLSVVDNLIQQIIEPRNTNLKDLEDKLAMLLIYCSNPEMPLYLVKRKLLHRMLDIKMLHVKEILIITTLRMFTGFFNDEAIELMSNDKDYIITFLKRVEYSNKLALVELLRFFQTKIIRIIQQNPRSNWIFRLKQFENLENFIVILFSTVDDHESIHYQLVITIIKLLGSMSETRVSFGMNLLGYLFNLDKLIPVLLKFCTRLVKTERDNLKGKIDVTDFISHWLLLMINMLKREKYILQSSNNEHNTLLDVIREILKPYVQSDIPSLISNIEQRDIHVICRCMNILSHIHMPYLSLMNMAFCLKTDLDSRKGDRYRETILRKLLLDIKMYWLWIAEHCDDLIISNIINMCKPEVKQYLTDLIVANGSRMAEEKLEKKNSLRTDVILK